MNNDCVLARIVMSYKYHAVLLKFAKRLKFAIYSLMQSVLEWRRSSFLKRFTHPLPPPHTPHTHTVRFQMDNCNKLKNMCSKEIGCKKKDKEPDGDTARGL